MTEPEFQNPKAEGKYNKTPDLKTKKIAPDVYEKGGNEKAADSIQVSENPALQAFLKRALTKVGRALKQQAAQEDSRAHRVQELLDALTAEEQRAFIEGRQTTGARIEHRAKVAFLPGYQSVAKQKLMGRENGSLKLGDFPLEEVWIYIVLGAVTTNPKDLARLLDSEMSTQLKMLDILASIIGLVPGEGAALGEALKQLTALAKAPAGWMTKVLPEIREAVREEARVEDVQDQTRGAVEEVQDAPASKKAA